MEGKINLIIRVGNELAFAEVIDRPEVMPQKDDVTYWKHYVCVVDYVTPNAIALQRARD